MEKEPFARPSQQVRMPLRVTRHSGTGLLQVELTEDDMPPLAHVPAFFEHPVTLDRGECRIDE
jgi:hypothetical protein